MNLLKFWWTGPNLTRPVAVGPHIRSQSVATSCQWNQSKTIQNWSRPECLSHEACNISFTHFFSSLSPVFKLVLSNSTTMICKSTWSKQPMEKAAAMAPSHIKKTTWSRPPKTKPLSPKKKARKWRLMSSESSEEESESSSSEGEQEPT